MAIVGYLLFFFLCFVWTRSAPLIGCDNVHASFLLRISVNVRIKISVNPTSDYDYHENGSTSL